MDFTYSISGFAVGTIVGLTGVGGGALMTPLLTLAFGVPAATAVGTDLLYAGLTKSAGTVAHARLGSVNWGTVGRLALGSLPAAALTLAALHRFFPDGLQEAGPLISYGLGIALISTALALLFRQRLASNAGSRSTVDREKTSTMSTAAAGFLLGVLITLTSVGAGALGAAALLRLYPGEPGARIVGTDIAHAVPLTLVAGLGHWWLGSVDLALLASLLIGSVPGIWIGSHLANRVPARVLKPVLALLLIATGSRLIFQ